MRVAYYCDLTVSRIDFEGACDMYLEWALGIRRFNQAAAGRVAVGINPRWSLRQLLDGNSFVGEHDARLSTRRGDGIFLLHLVHRDEEVPSEFWHNVVELRQSGAGTSIRHACGRSGPAGHEMQPRFGAPGVIRRMLRWNGPDVEPRSIGDASVITLHEDDASDVVEYFLLDRTRQTASVVVTPTKDTGQPLVDPIVLAGRVAGLARVLLCVDEAAVRAFTQALGRRGFGFEFSVGDGAVRLYLPGMEPHDNPYRHRFWIRARLVDWGLDVLTFLAGELAETAARGVIPRFFFEAVDRFDRSAVERTTEALLRDVRVEGDMQRQQAANAELRTQLAALRGELQKVNADYESSVRLLEEEVEIRQTKEQRLDEALQERWNADQRVAGLQRALEAQTKAADGGVTPAQRDALLTVTEGRILSPEQCLHILACLYGERVEILESAWASARGAAVFKHGDRLLQHVVVLVTKYWERMVGGGGDAGAREVFGDKVFAAKESKTTMTNDRARRERTFIFKDQTYVMWRHLKIGAKDAAEESIRVYFDWVADERKILIGHCGEHLYLLSFGM